MSYKRHFSRFLATAPDRLHFAAHSHHLWPDVTFAAQQQAWLDAASSHDDKWARILETVLPEARGHVARQLRLADAATVTFAPNTHEFVVRILSCFVPPGSGVMRPVRILTTDSEFHSFERQVRRLEEADLASVERVPAEPFATFPARLAEAASRGGHDLVFFSQVLFNSGFVVEDLAAIVAAVPDEQTLVVVDGYHGFMALPTDLRAVAARAFYLAGGYKYAMAGEGVCFLHCPPGYAPRPLDTGWFAGFADLERTDYVVSYPPGGDRFAGATFDPSGLYRFNAVQRLLVDAGVSVGAIHEHVHALQQRLVALVPDLASALVPPEPCPRGNFLTFRLRDAAHVQAELRERKVTVDHRGDRLRVGFGLYHDPQDVDLLAARFPPLPAVPSPTR